MSVGGLTLIDSQTASSVTYVELGGNANWDSSYDHYIVRWANVTVGTDNISFRMRVLSAGAEQSASSYNEACIVETSVSEYNNALQNYAEFYINYNSYGNDTGEVASGELFFGNMNQSSKYAIWCGS